MTLKGRIIPTILFCAYIAAVAVLCFMKPDSLPSIERDFFGLPIDKVVHFLMFLPYPLLAFAVFRIRENSVCRHLIMLAAIYAVGAILAYGTEILQAHTGYRSYEIKDFAADMTGMTAGCILTAGLIIHDRHRQI